MYQVSHGLISVSESSNYDVIVNFYSVVSCEPSLFKRGFRIRKWSETLVLLMLLL